MQAVTTSDEKTLTPLKIKVVSEGIQKIYKFSNGYGASVVSNKFSYGGEQDLWEMAVIFYTQEDSLDKWEFVYTTPITNNVLGWLSDFEVEEKLNQVKLLPKPKGNFSFGSAGAPTEYFPD